MDQKAQTDRKFGSQLSIVDAIHAVYQSFSSQEKRVADLILESPGELSVYAASELAKLAGVSNATITRFVRRAGFASYEELRVAARDARSWGAPLFQKQVDSESDTFLSAFAEAEVRNLTQAFNTLNRPEVDEITTALIVARKLVFIGFRNSHFLASYVHTQFLQFRDGTRIVPGPGQTVTERTADLTPEDVVVIIGLRRIVGVLKRHMEALHNRGVPIVLITDPSVRIVPAFARWTITCPVETPHIFDSYSGVQAVLRLLVFESFQKSGTQGRAYMKNIEVQHIDMGEFE